MSTSQRDIRYNIQKPSCIFILTENTSGHDLKTRVFINNLGIKRWKTAFLEESVPNTNHVFKFENAKNWHGANKAG